MKALAFEVWQIRILEALPWATRKIESEELVEEVTELALEK